MSNTVHQYDKLSNIHNFFFHPLHRHKEHKTKSILSVITNIALTIITGGLWLLPFGVVNRLDHRKVKILNKGAPGVNTTTSSSPPKTKKTKTGAANKNVELPETVFGKNDWARFGDVGEVPELPQELKDLLFTDCKIIPGKKVWETHILTLIPQTLATEHGLLWMTLENLESVVSNPCQYRKTNEGLGIKDFLNQNTYEARIPAHWVLITKEVLENTRDKTYDEQAEIIQQTADDTELSYTVPSTRDVVISLFMHHAKTGEKLHTNLNYTRCREKGQNGQQVLVGGFTGDGLMVRTRSDKTPKTQNDGMVAAIVM